MLFAQVEQFAREALAVDQNPTEPRNLEAGIEEESHPEGLEGGVADGGQEDV